MSKRFSDQIRRATWRPVPDETRAEHLAAIESAREVKAAWATDAGRVRRRVSVMVATAALVILPAGFALAAERSLPGDALYPVKKVTETLRSWVDEDVVAEHRIEELEKLVAADAAPEVIADQVDRATEEVDRLGASHRLGPRLDQATAVAAGDRIVEERDEGPPVTVGTTPAIIDVPTTTTTTMPPDRPATTTTVATTTTTTTVRTDAATRRVLGYVHAGPTCPVQRFPPDPDCADRPVAGAVLLILDPDETEVGRAESNVQGRFQIRLPDGAYILRPQPHDGLLGTAPSQEFKVAGGPVELDVAYDTGIR